VATSKKNERDQQLRDAKEGLDSLFGGKALISSEGKALREAPDRNARTEAARTFVERWGMPTDLGMLTLFVRQKDAELMTQALQSMLPLLDHAKGAELKLTRSAVNSAMLTMRTRDNRNAAKAVLDAIKD